MTTIIELSLDKLSEKELQLFNLVANLSGTMEFKEEQLKSNGTIAAYGKIHKQYLELFESTINEEIKNEALKRLIFLNWYSMLEPSCFTGIGELDDLTVFNSYAILNKYLKQNKLDKEFKWMLSYYSCWDYIILFLVENKLKELSNFVDSVDPSILYVPKNQLPKGSMDNRGQMGIYWKSLSVEIV